MDLRQRRRRMIQGGIDSTPLTGGTGRERGGKTATRDIVRIGGGIGAIQRRQKESVHENTDGGTSQSMTGIDTLGEIETGGGITPSGSIRDAMGRILVREVVLHEMNGVMTPTAVDDIAGTIPGHRRARDPEPLNLPEAGDIKIMVAVMTIAVAMITFFQ